jgi:hypothetical protein
MLLYAQMTADIGAVRTEMAKDSAAVRAEMAAINYNLTQQIASVNLNVEKLRGDVAAISASLKMLVPRGKPEAAPGVSSSQSDDK